MLAGDLCLTEFMASNSGTIDDSFGDSSDWIELYNASANSIDLSQYHLTDDATDLSKFSLPAASLLPGESILVFASNRDLVTAGGEIHANFSLSASGGYLALTDVNGNVLQDFGASYPEQLEDISYGVSMFSSSTPVEFVSAAANARMLIPDASNGPALGTAWTETSFNDASWSNATLPIGYENGSGYQNLINTTVPSGTTSTYLRIPFNLTSLSSTNDLTLNVRYDDGFVAYINGQLVADDRAPLNPLWNSTATSNHDDGAAVIYQEFDVSDGQQYLQAGQNVLAIQALNVGTSSSDYLFEATLEGFDVGVITPVEEGFLAVATPGSGNGQTFDGFVEEVEFSVEHGFFEENDPQFVALSTPTAGATIVYTTDGSDPAVDENLNPTNGTVYAGLITITETTIIRAAAFVAGNAPSLSRARTYIFTDDVVDQGSSAPGPGWPAPGNSSVNGVKIDYGIDPEIIAEFGEAAVEDALQSISSISVATDVDNLFDSSTGIYVNARNRGRNWERFSSVELIEPDGGGFQANTGIRIRGGFSRGNGFAKRSLRFFFRGEYGDAKLEYDFFNGEGADEFDVLDLRTSQNYAWSNGNDDRNTFLREVFGRDAQADLGHPYTRSRYHHLYLNGVYWGLYQTQERVEAFYGESYLGGDREDYDRLKNNNADGYRTEVADGNDEDWRQLFDLGQALADNPVANADNYWTMQGLNPDGTRNPSLPVLLDVDNLIDYEMIIFLTGGFDSSISNFLGNERANNWVALRNGETDDQGFQFFIHDNEHSLGVDSRSTDRTGPYFSANDSNYIWQNPGFIHQDLMNHPEYLLRFQDRVRQHFFNNGAFTTQNNIDRVEEREDVVAGAILSESARWGDAGRSGDPLTPVDWQDAVNDVKSWLTTRNNRVLNQLINDGLHSTIAPVVFSQHGGSVNAGFNLGMTTTAGNSQIYFTTDGTDPRAPGGSIVPNAQLFTGNATINGNTTINARVRLSNGQWSALTSASFQLTAVPADINSLRVTELHYNPSSPTAAELALAPNSTAGEYEFIEFTNVGTDPIDLSGVRISGGIVYDLPGSTLGVGQSVVIASNTNAFNARYGATFTPLGQYGPAHGLSNSGESLVISAADGSVIQSFAYSDDDNWPSLADGGGDSLQVIDVNGDYSDPLNWLPGRNENGTPGFEDTPVTSNSDLRITEVHYNPAVGGAEFVELMNFGSSTLDIGGYEFVEGVEFEFLSNASTLVAPGARVVVAGDLTEFTATYGGGLPVVGEFTNGSLSNGGERVILFDDSGNAIHDFVYDDMAPWSTLADGGGFSLVIIDENGDYSDPANWGPSDNIGGTPGTGSVVVTGDFDDDGMLTCSDINQLSAESAAGMNSAAFDVNSDGMVDGADVNHWIVTLKGTLLGDANLDFVVDASDFNVWNGSKFTSTTAWCSGNFNGDGVVDASDFNIWNSNKFQAALLVAPPVNDEAFTRELARPAGVVDLLTAPVETPVAVAAPAPVTVTGTVAIESTVERRRQAVAGTEESRIELIFADTDSDWWA